MKGLLFGLCFLLSILFPKPVNTYEEVRMDHPLFELKVGKVFEISDENDLDSDRKDADRWKVAVRPSVSLLFTKLEKWIPDYQFPADSVKPVFQRFTRLNVPEVEETTYSIDAYYENFPKKSPCLFRVEVSVPEVANQNLRSRKLVEVENLTVFFTLSTLPSPRQRKHLTESVIKALEKW